LLACLVILFMSPSCGRRRGNWVRVSLLFQAKLLRCSCTTGRDWPIGRFETVGRLSTSALQIYRLSVTAIVRNWSPRSKSKVTCCPANCVNSAVRLCASVTSLLFILRRISPSRKFALKAGVPRMTIATWSPGFPSSLWRVASGFLHGLDPELTIARVR
jgi:hypothetical protein